MPGLAPALLWTSGQGIGPAAPEPLRPQASQVQGQMSWLDNGHVMVGVDLGLGGSITSLSHKGGPNLVNSCDWGRQVQMSHYSGPIPFEPNGKKPHSAWAALGWNPIQSGDCFGHPSQVLAHSNNGKRIYVKTRPLQWPLENEPADCIFETWITLLGSAVKVRSRVTNNRSDLTQYPAKDQELPAVYANGPYHRIFTYTGDRPFTQAPLEEKASSFPWTRWQATEGWAALVDSTGKGLGIFHPGAVTFLGGFAGEKGSGGPKDFAAGYLAPLHQEILDHNIVYDFEYFLLAGTLQEIRQSVYRLAKPPAPPQFRFARDRQHWIYHNAQDEGWPIRNGLTVHLDQDDPQLISPPSFWIAESAPLLRIRAQFSSPSGEGRIYWTRFDAPNFSEKMSLPAAALGDGREREIVVNLASSPEYRGAITRLRWDPSPGGAPGSSVRVKSILLGRSRG